MIALFAALIAGPVPPAGTSTACVARFRAELPAIEALPAKKRVAPLLSLIAEGCALLVPELREAARIAAKLPKKARDESLTRAGERLAPEGCRPTRAAAELALTCHPPRLDFEPELLKGLDPGAFAFAAALAFELARTDLMDRIGGRLVGNLLLAAGLENRAP